MALKDLFKRVEICKRIIYDRSLHVNAEKKQSQVSTMISEGQQERMALDLGTFFSLSVLFCAMLCCAVIAVTA